MSIEGQIHIRLDPSSRDAVDIHSSRPQQVVALLHGLEPQAVQQKVPMLYALCGKAQWLAATRALQAATDEQLRPEYLHIGCQQQRSVVIEALQQYWWRVLIDLPQRLHLQPALSVFAPLRKTLTRLASEPADSDEIPYLLGKLDHAVKIELLGMPVARWLALGIEGWDDWLNRYPVAFPSWLRQLRQLLLQLPQIAPGEQRLADPLTDGQLQRLGAALGDQLDFGFNPSWHGRHPETGAWSYQQHNPWLQALEQRGESPVLLRMLARLLELLRLTDGLHQSFDPVFDRAKDATVLDSASPDQTASWIDQLSGAVTLAPGVGLGWVKTARGLLLHRLQLDRGRIIDYRILAPTEWNFHPQGPLAKGLERWLAVPPQQLSDWVGLQVLSLDPCVQYQFEVNTQRQVP
jgi:hypothetical protein